MLEFEKWPKLYFDSVPPDCPFDPPKLDANKRGRKKSSSSSRKRGKSKSKEQQSPEKTSTGAKSGYCELCDSNYRRLRQHLKGKKHQTIAKNSEIYKELDRILARGRSFADYLEEVRQKYEKQNQENNSPYSRR